MTINSSSQRLGAGFLRKMHASLDADGNPGDARLAHYDFKLSDQLIPLNQRIGQSIAIEFSGNICCINCNRSIQKSFNQGYCFPCFKALAECDLCIMRPETCHFHRGTCRDEAWALTHCMQPHYVYIANSSGLKVGITRGTQIPTRWIDQGAIQAMPIFKVAKRYHAGLLETAIKKHVSDRTDWRKMLKGGAAIADFTARAKQVIDATEADIAAIVVADEAAVWWQRLNQSAIEIRYPVQAYPRQVTSLNLDKTAVVSGKLLGIKGQYLIFDNGVINIRKFGGYEVTLVVQG